MSAIVVQPVATTAIAPHEAALMVLDEYLAPARELHRAREVLRSAYEDRPYLPSPDIVREWSLSGSPSARYCLDLIQRDLDTVPPRDDLEALAAVLSAATLDQVAGPPATVLVGLMLDGFRSRPTESTPTYIAAAVGLILDPTGEYGSDDAGPATSSASLAWAIRRIWRTSTFPPSLGELVEGCRQSERRFRSALNAVNSLIERRREAEELLAIASEAERAP